eukprot:7544280-Pyramimonas_sp.AAC.1
MPPKSKGKAKAQPRPGAPPPPQASDHEPDAMDVDQQSAKVLEEDMAKLRTINAPVWANFQRMLNVIKAHPVFQGVDMEDAPAIAQGA